MKYILSCLLFQIGLFFVTSCGNGGNVADDISAAEAAVNENDYEIAKSICESFVVDSTTTLGVDELCRLSVIYMKLSDIKDVDVNTAMATQCYGSAMHLSPDSATSFYSSLPVEEARHVQIMAQLYRVCIGDEPIYIDDDVDMDGCDEDVTIDVDEHYNDYLPQ